MTERIPLDVHVDRLWEVLEDGFHGRCESREMAQEFIQRLYDDYPDDVFHIEHYPATNGEDGSVEFIRLIIRRLEYDRKLGWFSEDIPSELNYVVEPADPEQDKLIQENDNA